MTTVSSHPKPDRSPPERFPAEACCPALWASPLLPAWAPALPVPQADRVQEASVSGGGGAEGYDGPPVKLAFWNGLTGGDGPIMRKMIKQFNAEHANIKVSMTAIAWAEYFQKLPAAVSNGKAPEIGLMHNDDLATNAARQVIIPAGRRGHGAEADRGRLPGRSPGTAGSTRTSDTAIPLDVHPAGLFYNKTVLEKVGADPEKPPTTGDELMAILDQCKSKGIQGMWTSALSVHRGSSPRRSSTSTAARWSTTTG